jgi:hypothetical protein
MQRLRWCSACRLTATIGDTASVDPADAAHAELRLVETLAEEIQVLTATLQGSLPSEEFGLVCQLRDAVGRLALAEEMLRERRLLDRLSRHLPGSAAAIRATGQHILGIDLTADGPV